jgi:hypothetical protein
LESLPTNVVDQQDEVAETNNNQSQELFVVDLHHSVSVGAVVSETVSEPPKTLFEATKERVDQCPEGSKLFVGNLPLGYDNTQELTDIFSKYGTIVGISFIPSPKMTYGFIQFDTTDAVKKSIEKEDRRLMSSGFKLDLLDALEREKMLTAKAVRAKSIVQPFPSNTSRQEQRGASNKRRKSPDRRKSPVRNNRERSYSPDTRQRKPYSPIRYIRQTPMAQLFVIGDVTERFVDKVENRCRNLHVTTHISYIPSYHIDRAAEDCFLDGVGGVMLLERRGEKNSTVTLMMKKNGNIKGNLCSLEFNNMSVEESCRYILREKDNKPVVSSNPVAALMPNLGGQIDPNVLLQIAAMQGGLPLLQNLVTMQGSVAQQLFPQNQGFSNIPSQSQVPGFAGVQQTSNLQSGYSLPQQQQQLQQLNQLLLSQLNKNN